MKKRVLSLLLALVIALSLAVPAFAADEFQAEEPAAPVEEEAPVMEEPAAPEEAPIVEEPAAPVEAAPAEPMPEEAPAVPVWEPEIADMPSAAAIDEPAPASREEDGLGDAYLVSPIIASGMYDGYSARKMLDLVNDFRTGPDAWYWNETNTAKVVLQDLQPLTYDYALERIAMWRAAELVLNFDHIRPDGTMPDSLIIHGVSTWAENIAYGTGPLGSMQSIFDGWAETNYGYAGQGHRRTMLSSRYTAIGIACFIYNGAYFWVQEFGYENSGAADLYAPPTLPAGAVAGGYCGYDWDNMIWYLTADGTLTFSGEGEMEDYDYSYTLWGEDFDPRNVRRIVVEEGITRIGAFVFASDDLLNVTEISLPSTLTSIGVGAFNGTFGFDELTLPAAVTTVEDYAFSGSGLTVRPAPGNESYVEKDGVLFTKDMSELVCCPWGRTGTYTVPSSVKTVRAGAFMLSGLTGVTLPEGLTEIGTEAFEYSELTKIEIPASVTKIGATAFGACEKLTSVTVLNPDCEIEEDAWGGGETLGLAGTATVYGHAGSTAQAFARQHGFTFKSLDGTAGEPSLESIKPPAGGTGWRYVPETGDYYYFKNYKRVGDFWIGKAEGGSKWADLWYYADADGKLLTGFQYLDDLKGGKAWYMLQVDNENGTTGKMLTDWQWTYTRAGWGYFSPSYGSQGMCLYTDAWGEYNAAWGLWQDGLAHRGTK